MFLPLDSKSSKDFPIGCLCEIQCGKTAFIIDHLVGDMLRVVYECDPKKKKIAIYSCVVKRIISFPLPLEIGDRVTDEEGIEAAVSLISDACINIESSDRITSYNLELAKPNIKKVPKLKNDIPTEPIRSGPGGKRLGAGRPVTGRKSRKTINLDSDYAAKLPDLKMLCDLLDEYREIADASTSSPRVQKLREFFKKFDALPKII